MSDRRQRIHELVLALIQRQEGLELLDGDGQGLGLGSASRSSSAQDPANWLERNRRLVQRYQALVRTAVTLDALIDQEVAGQL
jgi:hypothetical protein